MRSATIRRGSLGADGVGRDDRGAGIVEFVLVIPILLLFLFGIANLSLAFKDKSSVASSVRVGARTASTGAGAGPGACLPIVDPLDPPPPCTPGSAPALAQAAADAIRKAGSAMPEDQINYIVVYRADAANGNPPAGCLTPTITASNCVKFVWKKSNDRFAYAGGTWASTSINACINSPSAHAVGVYMNATHRWLFSGVFGNTVTLTDKSVMNFEPLPNDSCQANKAVGSGGHI